ncbi:MAG: hypothetical protein PUC75_01710 [Lachnospiraceae bacterium]|nr:hypothetical protein [Lachnospiraceae bacterium]MDD6448705.1 hypothetical protein [Lachnospiraceae bacterium]MDD6451920.1 hypothetical protein [Lachnospiraceae bacterium]MDD6578634.1 hypothetical protein [Lachnospiraceae bacterium]
MKISKKVMAVITELAGSIAIVGVLFLPNGKTLIDTIIDAEGVGQDYICGISYCSLSLIAVFLASYFISLKAFTKEQSTKIYVIFSTILMILTLVSKIIWG